MFWAHMSSEKAHAWPVLFCRREKQATTTHTHTHTHTTTNDERRRTEAPKQNKQARREKPITKKQKHTTHTQTAEGKCNFFHQQWGRKVNSGGQLSPATKKRVSVSNHWKTWRIVIQLAIELSQSSKGALPAPHFPNFAMASKNFEPHFDASLWDSGWGFGQSLFQSQESTKARDRCWDNWAVVLH